MAITLDSVLNFVIPIGIFVFLFFLFYSKFKGTFDLIFEKLKDIIGSISGSGSKAKAKVQEQYEYVYRV